MTRNEIRKLVGDSDDVVKLSHFDEVAGGEAFLRMVAKKRDSERDFMEREPNMSNDIRKDVRYRLGVIAGLNWVLDSVEGLKKYKQKLEKQDDEH